MAKRKVRGVGINDADYVVNKKNEGRCIFYQTWCGMLRRCYSEQKLIRSPTYRGCIVCKDWLTFSKFKFWMETQDYEEKQLDKDLLGDGKLYSPETCCFVELWLNNIFTDSVARRGKYSIGVSKNGNNFRSTIKINGHQKYIGCFSTEKANHEAYVKEKIQYVEDKMKDYPDERIKQAVLERVRNI